MESGTVTQLSVHTGELVSIGAVRAQRHLASGQEERRRCKTKRQQEPMRRFYWASASVSVHLGQRCPINIEQ